MTPSTAAGGGGPPHPPLLSPPGPSPRPPQSSLFHDDDDGDVDNGTPRDSDDYDGTEAFARASRLAGTAGASTSEWSPPEWPGVSSGPRASLSARFDRIVADEDGNNGNRYEDHDDTLTPTLGRRPPGAGGASGSGGRVFAWPDDGWGGDGGAPQSAGIGSADPVSTQRKSPEPTGTNEAVAALLASDAFAMWLADKSKGGSAPCPANVGERLARLRVLRRENPAAFRRVWHRRGGAAAGLGPGSAADAAQAGDLSGLPSPSALATFAAAAVDAAALGTLIRRLAVGEALSAAAAGSPLAPPALALVATSTVAVAAAVHSARRAGAGPSAGLVLGHLVLEADSGHLAGPARGAFAALGDASLLVGGWMLLVAANRSGRGLWAAIAGAGLAGVAVVTAASGGRTPGQLAAGLRPAVPAWGGLGARRLWAGAERE